MKQGAVLLIFLLGLIFVSKVNSEVEERKMNNGLHIVFVGASVGKAWDFPGWPERMNKTRYKFEMIPVYTFDKSEALEEILMRPKRKFKVSRTYIKSLLKPAPQKPDFIIIKECAAYFPGDMEKYKALVEKWHKRCKKSGVKLILAAVVPVTIERDNRQPGKLQGILEFNDWIKEYSEKQDVPVLDLEFATRISESDRSLRPDLTSGDGLHLNEKAYKELDKIVPVFLEKLKNN